MSKDKVNQEDGQNKGGRYPKHNAEYFTMKGNRPDELAIIKMQFGSEGIDFYVSVFETLCESDFFAYHFQNKYKLELLAKKKDIDKERFLEILKFCVEELELFNKALYDKGYIFSEAFLNSFDSAGLFRNRTMTADDVREKVKEFLGEVKVSLTDVNQEPASVKALIVKDTKAEESISKPEERRDKEKNKISKVEEEHSIQRETLKYKGENGKTNFPIDDDDSLPF